MSNVCPESHSHSQGPAELKEKADPGAKDGYPPTDMADMAPDINSLEEVGGHHLGGGFMSTNHFSGGSL